MLLLSLSQTFVGLRNGVSLARVIVVVAEIFIGSTDGLGQRVFEAQQMFDMPDMYAAIFAAGALGYGLNLRFLNHRTPLRSRGGQIAAATNSDASAKTDADRCFRRMRSSRYSYGKPFSNLDVS
jgi:hypothetical protein